MFAQCRGSFHVAFQRSIPVVEYDETNSMNSSTSPFALALQDLDPWNLPDSFTVYKLAPEYVRPFLHEHWKTQRAVHPIWSYFVGLFFLVLGKILLFLN